MTALKNNIDYYMKVKNIKDYAQLLREIAKELGEEDVYGYVEKEKSNFSNSLSGKRPLKYEHIIPLEKIFGVSLARLTDEDAYKLPAEKENVPYDKGFRYYAAKDDLELYKSALNRPDKDGHPIIGNCDEFGKTLIDYIIEYGSKNGVLYLIDTCNIRYKGYNKFWELNDTYSKLFFQIEVSIPFARLVASMKDAERFFSVFDSYSMFFTNGHYGEETGLFYNSDYLEILLENDFLFNELFVEKDYTVLVPNIEPKTYHTVNPILNNCLKCALENLDKYKKQAIKILKFGIKNNKNMIENNPLYALYWDGLQGRVAKNNDPNFYGFALRPSIFDNVGEEINDKEISDLIQEIKNINKGGFLL